MKTNNTRRSLWISGLSLILCVAMLVGTTFAWFTATVSNKGNRIEAGTLDLELYKNTVDEDINGNETPVVPLSIPDEEATDWVDITSQDAGNGNNGNYIFYINNWAPGDKATVYLAVKNAGSLALLYDIDLSVTDDSLASALTMQYTSKVSTEAPNFANMPGSKTIAPLSSVLEGSSFPKKANLTTVGELEANEVEYIAVTITFMESAGDSYQGKAFKADFSITAAQRKNGDTEDDNVADKVTKVYDYSDFTNVGKFDTVILMNDVTTDGDVSFAFPVNIDLNGYTLKVNNFSIITDDICTIDIANGDIYCDAIFNLHVRNATVNQAANITADKEIIVAVSNNTLNLTGKFISGKLTLNSGRMIVKPSAVLMTDELNISGGTKLQRQPGGIITNLEDDALPAGSESIEDVAGYTEDGVEIPAGSIVVEPGSNLKEILRTASSDDVFFLKNGTYSHVNIKSGEASSFLKKITLIGETRDGVILEGFYAVINATVENQAEYIFERMTFKGDTQNMVDKAYNLIRIQGYTLRLENCYIGAFTGKYNQADAETIYRTIEAAITARTFAYINNCSFDMTAQRYAYFNPGTLNVFTNNTFLTVNAVVNGDDFQRSFINTVFTGNIYPKSTNSNLYYTMNVGINPVPQTVADAIALIDPAHVDRLKELLSTNQNLAIRLAASGSGQQSQNYYITLDANGEFVEY